MLRHALGVPLDVVAAESHVAVQAGEAGGGALVHVCLQLGLHIKENLMSFAIV